jgi:hypothetical protein
MNRPNCVNQRSNALTVQVGCFIPLYYLSETLHESRERELGPEGILKKT